MPGAVALRVTQVLFLPYITVDGPVTAQVPFSSAHFTPAPGVGAGAGAVWANGLGTAGTAGAVWANGLGTAGTAGAVWANTAVLDTNKTIAEIMLVILNLQSKQLRWTTTVVEVLLQRIGGGLVDIPSYRVPAKVPECISPRLIPLQNVLATVPGDQIAGGANSLGSAEQSGEQSRQVRLTTIDKQSAVVTYERKQYRRGKHSHWYWCAVRAEYVGTPASSNYGVTQ